jgi:putative acetyltransferase
MKVTPATTTTQLNQLRTLFREYQVQLGVDLGFQHFEYELAALPGAYAIPGGGLLIAPDGQRALGCVALRPLRGDACEMKRLYVRPEARGHGLGRQLAVAVIELAHRAGHRSMRLDTLDSLTEAMGLYEDLGFRRTAPYYDNPLPGVVYWELVLT